MTEKKLSFFDKLADKVSFGMGTPKNILVWFVLVIGWTLLFALGGSHLASGDWMPRWFTSTGYNFPLNLVTTVAELFIGFLVAAAANRSERNLEDTLSKIEQLEEKLEALLTENTDLTQEVKNDTSLLNEIHSQVYNASRTHS